MSKFHINKHGVPAPCHAKQGNCPLGGNEQHFDNIQEAQDYADKVNEESHSLLPNVNDNAESEQEEMLRKLRDPAERAKLTKASLNKLADEKEKWENEIKNADNPEDRRIAGYELIAVKEEYDKVESRLKKQYEALEGLEDK